VGVFVTQPQIQHDSAPPVSAPAGDWVLTSFGARDNGAEVTSQPAVGQRRLHIEQGNGKHDSSILADLGCGATSGKIDLSRNSDGTSGTFSLGKLATTAMGCANQSTAAADMTTSLNYVFAGQGSRAYPHQVMWSYDGASLVLTAAPVVLVYVSADRATPPPPALLGSSWRLVNFTDTHNLTSSAVLDAFLQITANGVVIGNDGCNAIDTTADVSGSPEDSQGDAAGVVVFHSGAFSSATCLSSAVYNGVLFEAGGTAANGAAFWRIYGGDKLALWRDGAGTLIFTANDGIATRTSAPL
jgi:hypothetical protein